MKLNEQIFEKAEVLSTDKNTLPKGILARVRYPIVRFGIVNANKRMYESEIENVILKDSIVLERLRNRTLFGNMEHPENTNLQLNKDATSHIISSIYNGRDKGLDEKVLYAEFDILPTEAGKFINVLLEAGCKVGVSTRADGELEECINEADGTKYSKVVPSKYSFSTTDFTGDPSTPDVLPENIVKAVYSHYESRDIDKNVALALLETVNTKESKILESKIKEDKQHSDCKCKLGDKKCNEGCKLHINTEDKVKVLEQKLKEIETFSDKIDDSDKFGKTVQKNIQWEEEGFGFDVNLAVTFDAKGQIQSTEVTGIQVYTEDGATALTPTLQAKVKRYVDSLSYEDLRERIKKKSSTVNEEVKIEIPTDIRDFLTSHLEEFINTTDAIRQLMKKFKISIIDAGKYVKAIKASRGEVKEAMKDEVIKITKDTEKIKQITKELKDELKKSKVNEEELDISKMSKVQKIKQRDLELSAMDKKIKRQEEKVYNLEKKQLDKKVNEADTARVVELMKFLRPKAVEYFAECGVEATEENILDYLGVKIAEELGISYGEGEDLVNQESGIKTNESKSADKATNLSEGKLNEALSVLKKQVASLTAEKTKIVENYSKDIISATIQINELKEKLNESDKAVNANAQTILNTRCELVEGIKLIEKEREVTRKEVKELKETNKSALETINTYRKAISESDSRMTSLKEAHKKELVKEYFDTKIKIIGLKLPLSTQTLFEKCGTKEEVDNLIEEVRNAIRESSTHYVGAINEITVSRTSSDPKMAMLDRKIASVVKALG